MRLGHGRRQVPEHLLLAGEVLVEGRAGAAGRLGDELHRVSWKPCSPKTSSGAVEDPCAGCSHPAPPTSGLSPNGGRRTAAACRSMGADPTVGDSRRGSTASGASYADANRQKVGAQGDVPMQCRRPDPGERRRPRGRAARPVRRPPAGQVRRPRAARRHRRRRHRRVDVRGQRAAQRRASTPWPAGRPRSTASSRPRFDRDAPRLLRHPRARPRHERQRRARLDVLPVASRSSAASSSTTHDDKDVALAHAAGLQRLAHRRVVRHLPRPLHPARHPADLGPRADGRRGAPRRGQGLPRGHVLREPREARASRASTPTTGTRSGRPAATTEHGGVPAHRLVVAAGHHRARRADRRDDHAPADEHRAVRRRPAVVAGAAQVPRRCRSPCPRAASAGSRTSSSGSTTSTSTTSRGPARTSATSCPSEVFHEHVLTCFIDDAARHGDPPPPRHRPHHLGVRLPALRLHLARLARDGCWKYARRASPTPRSTRSPT